MVSQEDYFNTISLPVEGIYRDKGSKFLAYGWHIEKEVEIKNYIELLRKSHPSARHFCFAYRINPENEKWRANDDGEPSGSAGRPILGQIKSFNLHEILVVVVRYFGGTLLGVPGLINAYKQATYEALSNAKQIKGIITRTYQLESNFTEMGDLMRFLKEHHVEYDAPRMDTKMQISVRIPKSKSEQFKKLFVEKNWLVNP
jgi:uncharacterized YigZ family protein